MNNTVYGEEIKHAQKTYEVLCVSIVIYSIRGGKIGYTVTNMCSSGSKNQGILMEEVYSVIFVAKLL